MTKTPVIIVISVIILAVIGYFLFAKKSGPVTTTTPEPEVVLPINTLPLSERPFITLVPDSTGRTLVMSLDLMPSEGELEYEMIYDAGGSQQGAFGTLLLSSTQPITKDVLLGSKSGGGKISYHEGVTGGSLTVTYNETRLKESWNYLKFEPADPTISSVDGRFTITLPKTGLKKDTYLTTMKTFGYPKAGLPDSAKITAGPYSYGSQVKIKGSPIIEIKLPAGEHLNPIIYEWQTNIWKKLPTKLATDAVTATSSLSGGSYLVTTE